MTRHRGPDLVDLAPEGDALLDADGLRRRYGDVVAVADFSATVCAGEVVTVLGPNGCGKTTSLEMALGLRRRDGGSVQVLGLDPRTNRRRLAPYLGVALQGAALHARVRLREQLEYVAAAFGTGERWHDIVDALGLQAVIERPFGSLSGGLQRRAVVATALSSDPLLAVLDEPTSGVDLESRIQLWSAVRALLGSGEAGLLVTTHDLAEAEQHADRVIVMAAGRVLAAGSPAALLRDSRMARVVMLRRPAAATEWQLPANDGLRLASSPVEMTLGFVDPRAATALLDRLSDDEQPVSAACREPSLQDVYLHLVRMQAGSR